MPALDTVFQAAGWTGQAFFTARMLVQWYASEKAHRPVAPPLFWWLSVAGTLLLLCYALYLHDPVFALAPAANLFFYSRNLVLSAARPAPALSRWRLVPLALAGALLIGITFLTRVRQEMAAVATIWLVLGFLGSGLWVFRFLLQWWISERRGRSLLTAHFWGVSLAGAALLLAYSIHRRELIFILGYACPLPIILRNLVLIRRAGNEPPPGPTARGEG